MKTKLLLLLCCFFALTGAGAQTIAIVGEAVGGWPDNDPNTPDTHIMATTDNITYTLNGLVVTTAAPGGGAKFRQDGAWTNNWGSAAFPSGTGTQNGANILTVAGTYDITFNRTTGAYSFANTTSFPNIGIIGTAVNANGFDGPDVDMVTFDGINYSLTAYNFLGGEMKFRLDDAWTTSWGGTGFPTGTASTSFSGNISVPAGTYTLKFNITTGAYSFEFLKIGILGTAVSASGFSGPDTDLSTTDGVHYKLYNYTFTDGAAKFRQEDDWTVNWGGTDFPAGTGTQGGADIPVTAGSYTVDFNRVTGEYSFTTPVIYDSIGIIGTAVSATGFDGEDVNMTTIDGLNYTLENYTFTNGEAKFRLNDAWVTSWGAFSFPSGTGSDPGVNIPVTAGTYTVNFNRGNMNFSFVGTPAFPTVGILGTAVSANGFNGLDINMTTTDGETYTLNGYTFTAGEAKFRQDDAWNISWGSASFPSGTSDGSNIQVLAGTYDVTFTRSTGTYSFVISGGFPSIGVLGTAINADGFNGPDINMTSTDGVIYTLADFTFSNGEMKFRQDDIWDTNWGGTAFPSGTGELNSSSNIPVTAGTYTVTFNRLTAAYSFGGQPFPSVGILGDAVPGAPFDGTDVDLTTADGINYNLDGQDFVSGGAKFRQDNAWAINWGSADFPTGTGAQDGADIAVIGNRYNVYFNRTTGAYAFNYVNIGLNGSAVNGWDAADADLGTDDGINYQITDLTLVAGEMKFRQNHKWTVNWGSDVYPIGTALQDGGNIPITEPGQYSVTFNRLTGNYEIIQLLGVKDFANNVFKVYPNPSNNNWNFSCTNALITSVEIVDALGKTVLSKKTASNEAIIDASSLSNGLYFAKVTAADATQTLKVIKN